VKVDIDVSGLHQLTARLGDVPRNAWPRIYEAVETNARNIKDRWNENLGGATNPHSRMRHIGRSVDYDIGAAGGLISAAAGVAHGIEALIGPNLARSQGALAGWWEEGANGLPALHAGHDALRRNEQDLIDGLMQAATDALKDAL
jgi:hypothetical protein